MRNRDMSKQTQPTLITGDVVSTGTVTVPKDIKPEDEKKKSSDAS